MKAYAFDPITGAYTGEVKCQKNPLEILEFIVPAQATAIEPPKPSKGKWPVWNGKEWVLKSIKKEKEPVDHHPV